MSKVVRVNYQRCHPEKCSEGVCRAAEKCDIHSLRQLEQGEKPNIDISSCHGCFKCAGSCPMNAIEEVNS